MKPTPKRSGSSKISYPRELLHAIRKGLPTRGLPLQTDDGRVRWTDRLLAVTALVMAWGKTVGLRDAFASAREEAVAMYPSRRRPGRSYEGFVGAMEARSEGLVAAIAAFLRERVEAWAGRHWRSGPWVVMGADGSRVECPRTAANEAAFGCAGRKKTTPQQLVTLLFHVATGLPWSWRRGRGDDSERGQLRAQLGLLPARTLLLADAGFTGYDLLQAFMNAGHDFIVRVGKNVRLLRKLGYAVEEYDGLVYLWPESHRDHAPLILRLVRVQTERRAVCLLTSVLDADALSDAAVAGWYQRRWGIEVLYRSLKQTLGGRTLGSETPEAAAWELDWMVLGLWLLGTLTVEAQGPRVRDPSRWSVARALRAVRRWTGRRWARPTVGGLRGQLRRAVQDRYERRHPKTARDWPHKKNEPPPGEPKTRTATQAEVRLAKAYQAKTKRN
jgi:hypothetical protein